MKVILITQILIIMKKIFLLLAIILPFILTSCGDDNDVLSSMEQELVGEWAIIKTSAQVDDYHYVFKKERTGSRRHVVDGTVVTDIAFKWVLDGNKLTIDYGTGQILVMEITMKINQMHVVYVATGAAEDYNKVVNEEE